MIKVSFLIKRKPGLTLEEFRNHWKDIHGPLFASQPEVKKYARRYIQVHSTGQSLDAFPTSPYDGIVEIWFDDLDSVMKLFGSDNYANIIAKDELNFIDRGHILTFYGTEHVFI